MNEAALQLERQAADSEYGKYYRRHFSTRLPDGSIPPVEPVTQEVLRELNRLRQALQSTQTSTTSV